MYSDKRVTSWNGAVEVLKLMDDGSTYILMDDVLLDEKIRKEAVGTVKEPIYITAEQGLQINNEKTNVMTVNSDLVSPVQILSELIRRVKESIYIARCANKSSRLSSR